MKTGPERTVGWSEPVGEGAQCETEKKRKCNEATGATKAFGVSYRRF